MAQLTALFPRSGACRGGRQQILAALIVGSLAGALCAKLHCYTIPISFLYELRHPPLLRVFLLGAVFPCLLLLTAGLRLRLVSWLLFFAKGFLIAFTLCALAASGSDALSAVLPALLGRELTPLPAMIRFAASRQDAPEENDRALRPLAIVLLLQLLGLALYAALIT